jgi:3-methyladenine DNA glycosylase/8-oxoguanine DNA glycosylase
VALLSFPAPYDFELSTGRYRAFGLDLANLWHEDGLHRVVRAREVRLTALPGGADTDPLEPEAEPILRHYLGAPFDLDAFSAFAAGADPTLREIVARFPGYRPPLAPEPFETLVTSITAQQVSLYAAFAIRNRLIERFGVRAVHAFAFPTREAIAAAAPEQLVAVGFSRRKAEYAVGLARSDLDLDALATAPDDEIRARLVALPGIGEWTVDWFLARHLARPTAWPAGDLALRKALATFYPALTDARAAGERFHPFQNLTAHYLLLAYVTR